MSQDPQCGKLQTNGFTTHRYIVGKDNGLKDVFVYISKGCEGRTFPIPREPLELVQTNCAYQPHVVGIMVGQTLNVKNADPILHHVHSLPKVAGNTELNIAQTEQGQIASTTFAKPEVMVEFNSAIQVWMLAYVGVVDNPYFAVTDADGNFKIPNLPAGDYTLTAYHVKAHGATPGISQEIKITGSKPVVANFTVEVPH